MELLDLSDFFQTKAQANDFSARLGLIAQQLFETNFNLDKLLLEQFGVEKRDKFIILLRNNNINLGTTAALRDFFIKIQQKIAAMIVLTLILAFEPTVETLQQLSQWFILNTNRQVLFDIRVDPKIIAGVSIYFNSKYLDFSIKSRFDTILNETLARETKPSISPKELLDQNMEGASIKQ